MAVSITRAIGKFITDITGLAAFEGETANRERALPCVEVALVESQVTRRFAGRVNWYTRATGDDPIKAVKQIHRTGTLRITVIAKAENDGSSEAKCVAHRDTIVSAINAAVFGASGPALSDPKAPGESVGIYRMRVGSVYGVRPDLTREPIVHEATINVTVQYRETYTRDITGTITDVVPDYGAAFA